MLLDNLSERDVEKGRGYDDGSSTYGAYSDGGGGGRPWATSEDVLYFFFKVAVGNAVEVLDYMSAAR